MLFFATNKMSINRPNKIAVIEPYSGLEVIQVSVQKKINHFLVRRCYFFLVVKE